MNELDERICAIAESAFPELFTLACDIYDHPETGLQEFYASGRLVSFLREKGFAVETGTGGLETAFRATWENAPGGPSIGLLMEYDALEGLGHACGHHLQSAAVIGAALALREALTGFPFRLVLYGTPAEEKYGGKIAMAEAGCFRDVDLMFAYHASRDTSTFYQDKALRSVRVVFHGVPAHAAIAPEKGRSALDAMMLAFHALEIMREHVKEGCRIHYAVREGTGPSNIVPERAVSQITLRAPDKNYLADMEDRLSKILEGACLMTGTTVEAEPQPAYWELIPVESLREEILRRAEELGATKLSREKKCSAGSSDLGNVSWIVPTANVYTYFCDEAPHSETWLRKGKSTEARQSALFGAKILALAASSYILHPEKIKALKEEHLAAISAQ
ncbi:MAG: M20 family metallopeptidase [Lachnospiraceae bacterium]|nr:M20 family metallopeptidase [Lachnospiraceae bacterium]